MRIVITGGAGFLGTRLARKLLERSALTDARGRERRIESVVLLDVAPATVGGDPRVTVVTGDLADPAVIARAVTSDTDTVFHLAANADVRFGLNHPRKDLEQNTIATFNVLEDEEVRQGIKDYAQWPTIPQLYVNGEFVGGSDIMMEMYQSGELQQLLSPAN